MAIGRTSKPRRMTNAEVKTLLDSERGSALAAQSSSKLTADREAAMDYYNGKMSDMPSSAGRSKATSSDVADTIEGLMPGLMEIFCSGDEVVRFEPVGPDDVEKSAQETEYVNHVFMQQNPGFLILYSFIKDALLSKNGIVKVFWETKDVETTETYYDQPDDAFMMMAAQAGQGGIEIVEHTEKDDPNQPGAKLHDIKLCITSTQEGGKVMGVPPEEFGIEKNARSMRECNYCFHRVLSSEAKLIAEGYSADQIRELGAYTGTDNPEEVSRDTVDEHLLSGDDVNKAARIIEVYEHYIRMDYEGDGKAKLYKVCTGGEQGVILKQDDEDEICEFDAMPFASMTPIIVTHRFIGKSIADIVMDIQRIKTALVRNYLDNMYLQNNQRTEVAESHAGPNTLDDLLVSRPGGIVRTKNPGGLQVLAVPDIGQSVLPAIEYFDQTREWRTGVARQGQPTDPNQLQNQSATAANLGFTAAQAKMKLIARIMAETGIRDLFQLLHSTLRKHSSKPAIMRMSNNWIPVDPRDWKERNDMTITVGLGSGGTMEQLAHLQTIIAMQKEAAMHPQIGLIKPENFYNSAKELVRLSRMKGVERFFTDPKDNPATGQPPPPDPKLLEIQARIELEKMQAQADVATQDRKTQAEIALAEKKFELERELAIMEMNFKQRELQMKLEGHQMDLAHKASSHEMDMAAATHSASLKERAQDHKQSQANGKS